MVTALQEFRSNVLDYFQCLFNSVRDFHNRLTCQEHAFYFRNIEEWISLIPVSLALTICSWSLSFCAKNGSNETSLGMD